MRKKDAALDMRFPTVRCSADTLARVKTNAANAGMRQSDYIRTIAERGKITVVSGGGYAIDPVYVEQLRRIGVNLNQITKSVHERGGRVPLELLTVLDEINAVMEQAAEGV